MYSPDVENGGDGGYIDRELNVPPVLNILGDQCKQYNTGGPECLDDAAGESAVLRREELHHHGEGDALQPLDEDALHEAESDEDDETSHKVDADPDDALRVEAHQHHVLAPEAVGERAEDDAADHYAAEVDRRHQRGDEGAVAHQAPL